MSSFAPHPPITKYYASDAEKQRFVVELFDRAAPHYDRITSRMSLGLGARYRRQALARTGLRPGMRVLDVAVGTGLVARSAVAVAGHPRCVIGVDPSAGMLAQARRGAAIGLVQGVGEALPFASERFDLVSMGYALRHVDDLERAFREYRRVLRPGGRVLILEIARPRSRLALALTRWYFRTAVPWITRLGTGSPDAERLTRYYWDTIAECAPPERVVQALSAGGFREVRRRVFAGILNEYEGTRP